MLLRASQRTPGGLLRGHALPMSLQARVGGLDWAQASAWKTWTGFWMAAGVRGRAYHGAGWSGPSGGDGG